MSYNGMLVLMSTHPQHYGERPLLDNEEVRVIVRTRGVASYDDNQKPLAYRRQT